MEFVNPLQELAYSITGEYPFNPVLIEAIKFFFVNPYESLVVINNNCEVEYIDPLTENIFHIPHGTAKGKHIHQVLPHSQLPEVISTSKPHIGKILYVKERGRRLVSRFPLYRKGKIIGAVGRVILHSLEEMERIREEAQHLRKKVTQTEEQILDQHCAKYTFDHILGTSSVITQVKELAKNMARSNSDILIQGESGTGKELFAHAIHNESSRRTKPFVKINCPAIPIEIAESEIFGYEKGAFTGAKTGGKPGKFELAQGGTIFLDEIGALPMIIQAKLLRAVQEREIERVGGQRLTRLNVRFIAATNSDLRKLSEQGKFRLDLFFRLSKARLFIPPLREHPEDIAIFVKNYMNILTRSTGIDIKQISNETLDCLRKYSWQGNVRELINILEQSLFKAAGAEQISLEHLPDEIRQHSSCAKAQLPQGETLKDTIEQVEKTIISNALKKFRGNKRQTAQHLGIQRSLLYIKLKKYGLGSNSF